jgi:hypothetical protein
MSNLFSTLIGAAMGTPESLVETARPLLQPRFAAIEPVGELPEAATLPVAPTATAAAASAMPRTTDFALDFPAAAVPQAIAQPLLTEAKQAGQASINPVLASAAPAPMLLTPASLAQNTPAAMVTPPILPEDAPLSAPITSVFLPIARPDGAISTPFETSNMAGPKGFAQILPSRFEAALPERVAPATAAPGVAIHIGRIEVAAPTPAPPPPAARTTGAAARTTSAAARTGAIPRAAPRQSLDNYLAGRRR